jgi:hypothetical protein
VVAVLDELLAVVPGAASRRHADGDEQPGDDRPQQHRAERGEARRLTADQADHAVDHDRRQHRQQRGHDHLLDRRLGQKIDRA